MAEEEGVGGAESVPHPQLVAPSQLEARDAGGDAEAGRRVDEPEAGGAVAGDDDEAGRPQ